MYKKKLMGLGVVVISNTYIFFLIILLIFFQILIAYKAIKYKKSLDDKNVQLIQFHLDTKFICKSLIDSLDTTSSEEFCVSIIKNIKEYYNLEDIIIIDSFSMLDGENNTVLRSNIINFIQSNMENISQKLNDHQLTKIDIGNTQLNVDNSQPMNHVLYLMHLVSKDEGDGLIICVERKPSLINDNEKIGLENSINLLKTRLIY